MMLTKLEIKRAVKEFARLYKSFSYDEEYLAGDKIWTLHDEKEEKVYIFTVVGIEQGDSDVWEMYNGIQNITMGKVGRVYVAFGEEGIPYSAAKKLTRRFEKDTDSDYKADRMEIEGTGYVVWEYNESTPDYGERTSHGRRR